MKFRFFYALALAAGMLLFGASQASANYVLTITPTTGGFVGNPQEIVLRDAVLRPNDFTTANFSHTRFGNTGDYGNLVSATGYSDAIPRDDSIALILQINPEGVLQNLKYAVNTVFTAFIANLVNGQIIYSAVSDLVGQCSLTNHPCMGEAMLRVTNTSHPVPEPWSLPLLAAGLLGLGLVFRRTRLASNNHITGVAA